MIPVNVTVQRNGIKVSIAGKRTMLNNSAEVDAFKQGVRFACAAFVEKITKMQKDL